MPAHSENLYEAISGLVKPKVMALILRIVITSPVKRLVYNNSTTSLVVVILADEGGDLIMLRLILSVRATPGRFPKYSDAPRANYKCCLFYSVEFKQK